MKATLEKDAKPKDPTAPTNTSFKLKTSTPPVNWNQEQFIDGLNFREVVKSAAKAADSRSKTHEVDKDAKPRDLRKFHTHLKSSGMPSGAGYTVWEHTRASKREDEPLKLTFRLRDKSGKGDIKIQFKKSTPPDGEITFRVPRALTVAEVEEIEHAFKAGGMRSEKKLGHIIGELVRLKLSTMTFQNCETNFTDRAQTLKNDAQEKYHSLDPSLVNADRSSFSAHGKGGALQRHTDKGTAYQTRTYSRPAPVIGDVEKLNVQVTEGSGSAALTVELKGSNFSGAAHSGNGRITIDVPAEQALTVGDVEHIKELFNKAGKNTKWKLNNLIRKAVQMGLSKNLRIENVLIEDLDLSLADLQGLQMRNVTLRNVALRGADISQSKWNNIICENCEAQNLSGEDVKIENSDLRNLKATSSKFDNLDLDPTKNKLQGMDIRGTAFTGGSFVEFLANHLAGDKPDPAKVQQVKSRLKDVIIDKKTSLRKTSGEDAGLMQKIQEIGRPAFNRNYKMSLADLRQALSATPMVDSVSFGQVTQRGVGRFMVAAAVKVVEERQMPLAIAMDLQPNPNKEEEVVMRVLNQDGDPIDDEIITQTVEGGWAKDIDQQIKLLGKWLRRKREDSTVI